MEIRETPFFFNFTAGEAGEFIKKVWTPTAVQEQSQVESPSLSSINAVFLTAYSYRPPVPSYTGIICNSLVRLKILTKLMVPIMCCKSTVWCHEITATLPGIRLGDSKEVGAWPPRKCQPNFAGFLSPFSTIMKKKLPRYSLPWWQVTWIDDEPITPYNDWIVSVLKASMHECGSKFQNQINFQSHNPRYLTPEKQRKQRKNIFKNIKNVTAPVRDPWKITPTRSSDIQVRAKQI